MSAKTFTDIIQQYHEVLLERTSRLTRYTPIYSQVMEALKEEEILFASFDGEVLNLRFQGTKVTLNRLFKILRSCEFEPSRRPKEKEVEYYTYWEHLSGAQIWFQFTGTSCRRVQVGEETITRPLYEIICEEEADANSFQPAVD